MSTSEPEWSLNNGTRLQNGEFTSCHWTNVSPAPPGHVAQGEAARAPLSSPRPPQLLSWFHSIITSFQVRTLDAAGPGLPRNFSPGP
ncbi:unnamed protein product [Pleuronectes platessa]|uniref:Uncharacterized protein n=1 Tax=Pleuronectes platessa TaxID=8262 RepID=A0A9N7U2U6_PLEPL|nr:unnamed protein product [Pleuronectes platessa]